MNERVQTRAEVYRNRGRRLDAKARELRKQERDVLKVKTQKAQDARRDTMRKRGRVLDQIELCYRQHNPVQIEQSDEMSTSGTDRSLVPWEDLRS